MNETPFEARLEDRAAIQDCLARYARGVDRGDWDLVLSTYHPDAHDSHGDYRGGMDGFAAWLDKRLSGVDNSMHLLGQCLIEFAGPDWAFVETYFVSRRLVPPNDVQRAGLPADAAISREVAGRYVVVEASSQSVALGGVRSPKANLTWSRRDRDDPSWKAREELFARTVRRPA
jgi:hypothetical protein